MMTGPLGKLMGGLKLRRQAEEQGASAGAGLKDAPLQVDGLSVAYHRKPVLWDVSYTAPHSGLIAVVGPNGAGKSTFIKACLGIVPPLSGSVSIFGQSLRKARKRIGYMPQRSSVDWDFPVSVLDVVLMGRYGRIGWFRPIRKNDRESAMNCLEQVGLGDYADRQIGQLSGGQQQRVFLARALAQEADLYFMDEPFAGVDAATEAAILHVLQELDKKGKTVVCVHHDLQTVTDYFQHVLLLNKVRIADGPVAGTMTTENLEQTYAGRLNTADFAGAQE